MRLKYKTGLTTESLDEDLVVYIGEDTPYRLGEENPTGDIIIQDVDGRQICLDKMVAPIMIEWLANFVERAQRKQRGLLVFSPKRQLENDMQEQVDRDYDRLCAEGDS